MHPTITSRPLAPSSNQRRPLSDDQRQAVEARKVVFIAEIARWVQDRRDENRLTREQLGALGGLERMQAQRQSLLDNLAHFYRQNPNADAAPGVLALATIFSDNNDGCCSLSVARMAQFLSRSPRRVRDAVSRLKDDNVLVVDEEVGATNRIYPWVHVAFGSTKDPMTWLMDVRAPKPQARRAGRPPQNTPDASVTPIFDGPLTPVTNTPDAGDVIPLTPASPNTTNLDTTNNKGESAKSRAPGSGSLEGSEVEGLGNGVEHLWEALVAQSLGSQPKGDGVRIWKDAVSRSEDCRRISETDAHELASVIAKAERYWPAAALVAEAVTTRASRERARLAAIAEFEAWRPLREAYIADKNRSDTIAGMVPEPTWEDAKALAEQIRKSGDRPNVLAAEQKLYADRQWKIASLVQEAGIDLDRHPLEARESKPEPSKSPAEFCWPNREPQGRSKQPARSVTRA
jgi:hypothetical protein